MAHLEIRNEKVEMRLTKSAKQILQTAASAMQRSVSEFVLESALALAETLPDRRRFGLNKAQWESFHKALEMPPVPSRWLANLLKEPSVFERGGL